MTTATRTHRTAGLSAEQRRARQDELLAALADGVLELTTSQGWRRYLRAMATLRTYSTGNTRISKPVNATADTHVVAVSRRSIRQGRLPLTVAGSDARRGGDSTARAWRADAGSPRPCRWDRSPSSRRSRRREQTDAQRCRPDRPGRAPGGRERAGRRSGGTGR